MRCRRTATSLLFPPLLLKLEATSDADDRLQQLCRDLLHLDLHRSEIPREALAVPTFSLGWRDEDLQRRRVKSVAVTDLNATAGTSRFDLSWRWRRAHGGGAIAASRDRGRGFDITLTATADCHRLLLSLTRFLRSKSDERTNRFFWALIEPTTSDSIHIDWSASGRAVADLPGAFALN